jgi:hypothetical protein
MSGYEKSAADYEKEISEIDSVFAALNLRARALRREIEENDIPRSIIIKSSYFRLAADLDHIRELGLSSDDFMDLAIRNQSRRRHSTR